MPRRRARASERRCWQVVQLVPYFRAKAGIACAGNDENASSVAAAMTMRIALMFLPPHQPLADMMDKYTHKSAYLWLDATGCRRVRTIKASQRRSTPIDTQEGPGDPGSSG